MPFLSAVPTSLKVLLPLAAGGALAVAIVLAAARDDDSARLTTARTPTPPVVEKSSARTVGSLAEMKELGEEATAAARAVAPEVFLFMMSYRGDTGLYAFGFTGPSGRPQVAVAGPYDEPGKLRFEAKATELFPTPVANPGPLDIPPALDLKALRRSPATVVRLFAQKLGWPESDVVVQVWADLETHQPVWGAGPASFQPTEPADRSGPVLCLLVDATATWIEPC